MLPPLPHARKHGCVSPNEIVNYLHYVKLFNTVIISFLQDNPFILINLWCIHRHHKHTHMHTYTHLPSAHQILSYLESLGDDFDLRSTSAHLHIITSRLLNQLAEILSLMVTLDSTFILTRNSATLLSLPHTSNHVANNQ